MVDRIEKEFKSVEDDVGWTPFFMGIRSEVPNTQFDFNEAKRSQNRKLNRYQDVNPYDHSRICLRDAPCDYINASLVSVEKADRKYILTQGPLPHTTPHFWLMTWEQKSRAIIMLNRVIEKNMLKCHQYWPTANEDSYTFSEVGLKVSNVYEEKFSYYTIAKLKLENLKNGESREVVHFHYTTWPDFGCPQSPTAFLRFLALVRESGALDKPTEPAIVHCSAGIGRSGTFCLVDSCLRMVKELGLQNVVVRDVLIEMRKYRMGLVQTADQMRFSYLAILEGLRTDFTSNGTLIEDCGMLDNVEEDEPPPLPPRGESLRIRSTAGNRSDEEASNSNYLRKREREEKHEKLENKVKEVKKKLKATEHRKDLQRGLTRPLGVAALLIVSGYLIYTWWRG